MEASRAGAVPDADMGKENACNALVAFTFLGILSPYPGSRQRSMKLLLKDYLSRILNETIEEHQALQFRLSELQSARRIEQVAIERLGMEKPTQVIHVEPTLH